VKASVSSKVGFAALTAAVVMGWRSRRCLPFSWDPEIAEVSAAEDLGYTEGPVGLENGKVIARFYSAWKHHNGRWLVIFDNGYEVCECKKRLNAK
jgi:hypothetical protein